MGPKVRKMISNQVLAARVVDDNGGWLFELKTDGTVMWIQPHRKEEAAEHFIKVFNVKPAIREAVIDNLINGKLTMELMGEIFPALK